MGWQMLSTQGSERRFPKLRKKWFDIKLNAKKRVMAHRPETSLTGGGQAATQLTPMDTRIASIIGDTALCGIIPGGDTDNLSTEPAVPSTSQTKYSKILNDVEIIFPRTLSI